MAIITTPVAHSVEGTAASTVLAATHTPPSRVEAAVAAATAPLLEGIASAAPSTSSTATETPAIPSLRSVRTSTFSTREERQISASLAASRSSVSLSSSSSTSLPIPERPISQRLVDEFFNSTPTMFKAYPTSMLSYCATKDALSYRLINRSCAVGAADILLTQLKFRATNHPADRIGLSVDSLEKFRNGLKKEWDELLPPLELTHLRPSPRRPADGRINNYNENPVVVAEALVKNCKKLTHMSFPWYWSEYTTTIMDLIKKSSNLTSIDLSDINLSEDNCDSLTTAIRVGGRHITHINCGFVAFSQAAFRDLINACPDLENATFDHCGLVDESARTLAKVCSKLIILNYAYNNLTAAGLELIAKGCKRLTSLDCSATSGLKEINCQAIFQALPALDTLSCNSCDITAPILRTIAAHCGGLKIVDLSSNSKISGAGLVDFVKVLPLLTSINCTSCNLLKSEHLIAMAPFCPNLEVFNCSFCYQISYRALETFIANCPKLKIIDCLGCNFPIERVLRLKSLCSSR